MNVMKGMTMMMVNVLYPTSAHNFQSLRFMRIVRGSTTIPNLNEDWLGEILAASGMSDPIFAGFPFPNDGMPHMAKILLIGVDAYVYFDDVSKGFIIDGLSYDFHHPAGKVAPTIPHSATAQRVWDDVYGNWTYKRNTVPQPTGVVGKISDERTISFVDDVAIKHKWSGFCKTCKSSSNHAMTHPRGLCYECSTK